MKAKDVLANIPIECECEVEELKNIAKNSKVKGFVKSIQCDYCKAKALENQIELEKIQEKQEINSMINKKAQQIAKDKLIEEGTIEEIDGELRKK
jgi:hypothetical protein